MDKAWEFIGLFGAGTSYISQYIEGWVRLITLFGGLIIVILSIAHGIQKYYINKKTIDKLRDKVSQELDSNKK